MTRNEYLYILRKNLQSLPIDEIDDIINDVPVILTLGWRKERVKRKSQSN